MHKVILYGIKTCDTVNKARQWLNENGIDYQFIDFKTTSPEAALLNQWISQSGLDTVINKRGTTWRKLSPDLQQKILENADLNPLIANPSIIKRPVLQTQRGLYFGFTPDVYANALKQDHASTPSNV
jgi:arsenate reductase